MNDSGNIRLYDAGFQSQHAAKCDVLLRLTNNRLQLAIVDQLQDKLRLISDHAIRHPVNDVVSVLLDEPFLKFNYRKVKILLPAREFVFIPADVYQEAQLPSYASFISGAQQIIATPVRTARVRSIAGVEKAVLQSLNIQFNRPLFFSQAEPLIESFMKAYFKPMEQQLLLQFSGPVVEILLTEGKKLKFYNVFDRQTPDELNYFLLLLIRQLNLDTGTFVFVSGDISRDDEYFARLCKYFKNLSFADTHKQLFGAGTFAELPAYRYFPLLAANVCE